MSRLIVVLAVGIALCMVGSLVVAQTETIVDARDRAPVTTGSWVWTRSVNPDTTLRAVLMIAEPNLQPGSRVDYELVITNTGQKAVAIPRTLDWKEVSSGGVEPQYLRGSVEFQLSAENMTTPVMQKLNVFSLEEKPTTSLVLSPGDSIRFVGKMVLPEQAFGPNWRGDAKLVAHFCESSVWMAQQKSLWCVSSDEEYKVKYSPAQ